MGAAAIPAGGISRTGLMRPGRSVARRTWVLGERLTPDLLLGSGLILGGVAFAALPARRPP